MSEANPFSLELLLLGSVIVDDYLPSLILCFQMVKENFALQLLKDLYYLCVPSAVKEGTGVGRDSQGHFTVTMPKLQRLVRQTASRANCTAISQSGAALDSGKAWEAEE